MPSKSFYGLAAQAHKLKPVVMIGSKGLTEAVQTEISQALDHHELIKIKIATSHSEDRAAMIREICETQQAQCIKKIGHMVVIYRRNDSASR